MSSNTPLPPEGLPDFFEPIRRLGEGGMGVVWSVKDKRVQKVGALKAIRPSAVITEVNTTRFEREIRNFAQLRHPYIVQVYDVGRLLNGVPYIFMEQINGQPLNAEHLVDFDFPEIILFFDRILEGLEEAHCMSLIHRDLKPDNILVVEERYPNGEIKLVPKLMDFGLALKADDTDTRITVDGMVVGTPLYMAPEQACDEHYKICPATDLYALGCIFYEIFCGKAPFEGKNAVTVLLAQASKEPPPFIPAPAFSDMVKIEPIINRLLTKHPETRYETAADLRAEFRRRGFIQDNLQFGFSKLQSEKDKTDNHIQDDNAQFIPSQLEPQAYQQVLEENYDTHSQYSVLSLHEPSFVGRITARQSLKQYLSEVYWQRKMAICLINGKPGVGKTRLAREFVNEARKSATADAFYLDIASHGDISFAFFNALFSRLLLHTIHFTQTALALMRFFHVDYHDERVNAMLKLFEAENSHTKVNLPNNILDECLHDALVFLTHSRPLILIIDNIQNLPSQNIVQFLNAIHQNKKTKNLPILILLLNTSINDVPTDIELNLGKNPNLWLRRPIYLGQLSNADMANLVEHGLSIGMPLAQYIENLSTGYPYIATALARHWQLAGFLKPSPRGYLSETSPESLPIPKIVHESILSHLNLTFAEYSKDSWLPIANFAAILGSTFSRKVLLQGLQLIPTRMPLLRLSQFLNLAFASSVIQTVEQKADDTLLAFSNPVMGDALKATMSRQQLLEYNGFAAAAKRCLPKSLETAIEIAQHLETAQKYFETYRAYYEIASLLHLRGKLDDALGYLESAKKALILHLGSEDVQSQDLCRIWLIESEIFIQKCDINSAQKRLDWLLFAFQFFKDAYWDASIALLKARILFLRQKFDEAETTLEKAYEICGTIQPPISKAMLEIKFSIELNYAQFQPKILNDALKTAKELQNSLFVGKAVLALAKQAVYATNDREKLVKIINMAIETANRCGDVKTEAEALYTLASIQKSRPELARKTLHEALACYEKTGEISGMVVVLKDIVSLLKAEGKTADAMIYERWIELLCGNPIQESQEIR